MQHNKTETLTILTGKNFRSSSTQEFVKIESWLHLIDTFDISAHAIKFYIFHSHIKEDIYLNRIIHKMTRKRTLASLHQTLQ